MRFRDLILSALPLLATLAPASLMGQSYTDAELLANGTQAWDHDECVQAAKFMFAYSLRNPAAYQTSAEHRRAVQTVIQWCEAHATIAAGSKGDDPSHEPVQPKRPPVNLTAPQAPHGGAVVAGAIAAHKVIAAEVVGKQITPVAATVAPDPTPQYQITSALPGGNVITEVSGSPYPTIVQSTPTGATAQRWQLVPLAGPNAGYYHVVSVASNLCLNVTGSSLDDGARLITYQCQDAADNDRWALAATDDGNYTLRAKHSGKAIDVNGSDGTAGLPLQQWAYHGGPNQRWRLVVAACR